MPRTSAASPSAYIKQTRTRRASSPIDDGDDESGLDLYEDGVKQEVLSALAGQGRSARCYGSDEVLEFN